MTGLDLAGEKAERGPGEMASGLRGRFPGKRVKTGLHRPSQQVVPGGMEFDLVDAMSALVMGAEPGRVLVGGEPELIALGARHFATEANRVLHRPSGLSFEER